MGPRRVAMQSIRVQTFDEIRPISQCTLGVGHVHCKVEILSRLKSLLEVDSRKEVLIYDRQALNGSRLRR